MRNCDVCGGKKWLPIIDRKTGLQKTTNDGRLLYSCFRSPHHIQAEEYPFLPAKERGAEASVLYFDLEIAKSIYFNYGRKVHSKYLKGQDLIQEYFVICWAASYMGSSKIFSGCVTPEQAVSGTDKEILQPLYDLLSSAAIVAGHNVDAFDLKKINTRFISNGIPPVMGYDGKRKPTQDSLKIVRSHFDFEDNGMDALCKKFGINGKDKITDEDWREIVKTGNPATLAKVDKYCRGDVRNGKELLKIFQPYAGKRPDYGAKKAVK